jgi:3-hydroxyisobutyrate dehydrogenase-like beta-hydroxyacid dehydrogenase
MPESLGFLGIGRMGEPMARNLIAAGYAVKAYNRTPDKAKSLAGATAVGSPVDAVEPGGVVVSMLADDAALRAVSTDALLAKLGPGGVHVSMSTVSPAVVVELAKQHQQHGVRFVSAPVFGRPEAAAPKKLWIALAGPADAKQRALPILNAVGQGVFDFGDRPELANVVKLAGNFLIFAAIESMAEAAALGEKYGLPRKTLLNMFTQTLFAAPVYQLYAKKIIDADFDKVGFGASLAMKDMKLAQSAAADRGVTLPSLELILQRFQTLTATDRASLDASSVAAVAAEEAGLKW